MKLCASKLEFTGFPNDELQTGCHSFYKKLLAADSYDVSGVFKGKVVLFRAEQNYVKIDKDYGLKKVWYMVSSLSSLGRSNAILTGTNRVKCPFLAREL